MCVHVCVWHYSISLTEFKTDVELTIWSPPSLAELSGWNLGCSSQPNVQPRISRPFSDINRTPWKFGKCCCISVQLEKPKHMKQSGFVQHRTRWIMESISLSSLTRPLDGDTSNQICEKCRYLWKYISQGFLKDLSAKVQTFFPLEESLTMSQIWTVVWEGVFWFSNRVWGAAFRLAHFELPAFTKYPFSHAGEKYSRVVWKFQVLCFLLHKGALPALQIPGSPEVTTLAAAFCPAPT